MGIKRIDPNRESKKAPRGRSKKKTPRAERRPYLPKPGADQGFALFCGQGHKLAADGFPVTLENCAGNLYSELDPICRACKLCKQFVSKYRQPESIGTVFALLYPQKEVAYFGAHAA